MEKDYIQVSGKDFVLNNKKVMLRGFGTGSWMNIEHFLIGLPGTERMLRNLFSSIYGREKSNEFFDLLLSSFLTDDDFCLLKNLGVNVLRIAINYHHFLDDYTPGKIKSRGFIHIDRILDLCKHYGIYAVLDLHAVPGGQNPDWHSDNETGMPLFWDHVCFQDQIIDLWSHIAAHYAGNPFVAGYDLVNEPCLVPDRNVFNDFFTRAVRAVREKDRDHIIFIEGDDWGKDFSLFDPIDDPQLAYSFHLYPFHILDDKNPGKWSVAALKKAVAPFLKLQEETNRPLWCGETGNRFSRPHIKKQVAVLQQMLDVYEEYKISWSIWSYKDAGTMSLLFSADNTPWNRFVKEIREEWNLNKEIILANEMLDRLHKHHFKRMDEHLRYKLHFRLRGVLQNLYMEELVRPRVEKIPWEEMKTYPGSFFYKNCNQWEEVADLVRSYTAPASPVIYNE